MTQNSAILPGDLVSVLPQFDLTVIGTRGDKIGCWMKCDPVAAFLVTLQHFDALYFDTDVASRGLSFGQFLPKNREVPNPNSGV